jgi:ABC-type multidrug transport system permease subunit
MAAPLLHSVRDGRWTVWMLRVSLTCLVFGLMALLFFPFAFAKALAGVLGLLFVVFLVLGLATVDNFAT